MQHLRAFRTVREMPYYAEDSRLERHLEMSAHILAGFQLHNVAADGLSVEEQLHIAGVGVYQHVYLLPGDKVPVRRNYVQYLFLLRAYPHALVEVVDILGESRRVDNAEVAVLGVVGRRLADVVEACPDELSAAEWAVAVEPP